MGPVISLYPFTVLMARDTSLSYVNTKPILPLPHTHVSLPPFPLQEWHPATRRWEGEREEWVVDPSVGRMQLFGRNRSLKRCVQGIFECG